MDKKLTKYWNKEYKIDLTAQKLGAVFYNEFKDVLDSLNKTTMGIEIVLDKVYTFKTFILWANKLRKLNAINDERINQFFELLETNDSNSGEELIHNGGGNEPLQIPYTEAQESVFDISNRLLELLKQALVNSIEAEKLCFKEFIRNNPKEEAGNCLWRIRDVLKPILKEIDRCEPIDSGKASTMPAYKEKPKVRSVIDKIQQVKELI